MSERTIERISAALAGEDEADNALRRAVSVLVEEPGIAWAGIAFLEEGALVLGPTAGDDAGVEHETVAIEFDGAPVGELRVAGTVDRRLLERVAELVSPYALIGWDTGGEVWEP